MMSEETNDFKPLADADDATSQQPVAAAADLLARIGGPMARRGLMNERLIGGASLLAAVPAGQLAVAEKRILPRLKS